MSPRLAGLLAILVVLATGCGGAGPAASPTGVSSPVATDATPTEADRPSTNPGEAAASSYRAALAAYLDAVEGAGPDCATQTLTAQRRCFDTSLAALDRFESRIRATEFPAEVAGDAAALLDSMGTLDELLAGARDEGDVGRLADRWWPQIDPADVAVLEAADRVRRDLGLPPITSD